MERGCPAARANRRPVQEVDVSLIQATMRPGEILAGVVSIEGPGDPVVQLTFQGEEVLAASSTAFNYVVPFFEIATTVDCSAGPAEFHFELPQALPPTYFSSDIRCLYCLKARRKGIPGFLGLKREAIRRINIPMLAPPYDGAQEQHWFVLKAGGAELEVSLDSVVVVAGASLTGELLLRQVSDEPMPTCFSFRLAAIEEVTKSGYYHRRVSGLQTYEVRPEEGMTYPLQGFFEFPIGLDDPASGDWHTFKVHYGFRVGAMLADGNEVRQSLPVLIRREPSPRHDSEDGPGISPL